MNIKKIIGTIKNILIWIGLIFLGILFAIALIFGETGLEFLLRIIFERIPTDLLMYPIFLSFIAILTYILIDTTLRKELTTKQKTKVSILTLVLLSLFIFFLILYTLSR